MYKQEKNDVFEYSSCLKKSEVVRTMLTDTHLNTSNTYIQTYMHMLTYTHTQVLNSLSDPTTKEKKKKDADCS